MDGAIFLEVSLILVVATVVAGAMQLLRQPLIIGHIFTGLLVGPSVFNLVKSTETAELMSHFGIALLLFIIGLGLNPRVVREVGKVAVITGLGQIIFTTLAGFGLAKALGFGSLAALYIAVALTFSSTIIVLKLLSDKKEIHRLYGKIATGFLLVQDVVAALVLIFIPVLATHSVGSSWSNVLLLTVAKGIVFLGLLAFMAIYILPRLSNFFARAQEYLFLFSVGWGFGVAALSAALGFSLEIGALAAGVALAGSPYSYEITSRMRPLRDFFIIIFFIVLGTRIDLGDISATIIPALIFSGYILIGNPTIMMAIMGILGYTKKTSFKTGLTVAQISEFSLVLIILGSNVGHLEDSVVSMVTLVGLITIAASTYLMLYDDKIYQRLAPALSFFERQNLKPAKETVSAYQIILFGYTAGSEHFIRTFKKLGHRFLVVDYSPETIDFLKSQNIPCRYGDANDSEFLEELELDSARMVVINVTEFAANKLIVRHVRYQSKRAIIIAMNRTDKAENTLELYEDGANYVMMPHHQNSIKISSMINRYHFNTKDFEQLKTKQTRSLMAENS